MKSYIELRIWLKGNEGKSDVEIAAEAIKDHIHDEYDDRMNLPVTIVDVTYEIKEYNS